jgi:hypothetical protein
VEFANAARERRIPTTVTGGVGGRHTFV